MIRKAMVVAMLLVLVATIFVLVAVHPRNYYYFTSDIKTLSVANAEVFAEQEGELNLNGLTRLSREVAEALADHKGGLYLDGLRTISPEAAEALAHTKYILSLNGLTALS